MRSATRTPSTNRSAHATRTVRRAHRTREALRKRPRREAAAPFEGRRAPTRQVRAGVRPSARLHLTGRGRLLVVLGLLAMLLTAFSLGRTADTQAAVEPEPRAAVVQTTVQPGETLWAVAQRIAPTSDPRAVVQQIRRLNDLPDSSLQVGQQLLLPA